jgi:hypothetical protein
MMKVMNSRYFWRPQVKIAKRIRISISVIQTHQSTCRTECRRKVRFGLDFALSLEGLKELWGHNLYFCSVSSYILTHFNYPAQEIRGQTIPSG